MAIKSLADKPVPAKIEIDLTGPDGNAYALLAYADRFGRQLNFTQTKRDEIYKDMTSSDYDHLLEVFDKHFGDYVDLYR